MTNALCWNCGNIKWGAYNPCATCNYKPKKEEYNQYLSASDHFYSVKFLEDRGQEMQRGEDPRFDLEDVQEAPYGGLSNRLKEWIRGFTIADLCLYFKDTWFPWLLYSFFLLALYFCF